MDSSAFILDHELTPIVQKNPPRQARGKADTT